MKKIIEKEISEEMKESYIDYAMSVIVSRAIPDVRDGLKPVQRRILYAMYEMGLKAEGKFRKCAAVTGEVMGKYHPHGDAPVYEALVRMAQDFTLRYPLIKGQGNFGCFTKDTKVKLTDGKNISFEDLIKEQKQGKRHWTFTFNPQTKKIEIAEIKNPRLTRKNEKIMEVILDNGEKIKCTLDHLFMLRDGTYKQAKDLKREDLLMPFYVEGEGRNLKGGEMVCLKDVYQLKEKTINHKVKKVRFLRKKEDVYDLTVEPWHNFALAAGIFVHNSIDGDPPAAQRYTECKLSKIGQEMLKDIEKETVDFVPNYDGTRFEPTILPSPLPNILINGSLGIAVGMTTNIPPHNLSEIVDALIFLLDHPKAEIEEIFQFIQGPDFPTGGLIFNKNDIIKAYCQGRGPIVCRAKAQIFEDKKGKKKILITEIPYQVSKSELLEELAKLVEGKKIEGIRDIRDESDREGLRITIDLKKEVEAEIILELLYRNTQLQKTFHLNMVALIEGIQPKLLNLLEILNAFLEHRKNVVVRRTKFDLKKSRERAHILEGLEKCLGKIDEVIKTIKLSESREKAKTNLMKKFGLDNVQTEAILETKLVSLAKLEREKITAELKEKREEIKMLEKILKSEKLIKEEIKKELKELKEKYGDERKTKLIDKKIIEISEKDLIPSEDNLIIITKEGFIKRVDPEEYKIQKRGGKGILGIKTKEEDIVEHFALVNTKDKLFVFVESGKVFAIPIYEIPKEKRKGKGKSVFSLFTIQQKEKILTLAEIKEKEKNDFLVFATKNGKIKKCKISEFESIRKSGLIAINLKKGDSLKSVKKAKEGDFILLYTKKGQAIISKEKDVREMGRQAEGVTGIRLRKDDEVAGMEIIPKEEKGLFLLSISEKGFGKRTQLKEFRIQKRGGMGIKIAKINQKTGNLSRVLITRGEENLILVTEKGKFLRTKISSIPKMKRQSRGVRIMKVEEDKIISSILI